jgi:ABC-type antimicrobial peptide transport system permease subunit
MVDRAVSPRRFIVVLLTGFSVFALVLASLGIYAVISYLVTQRTQEFGIRMALGASDKDVQRQVIGRTLYLALAGITIGAVGSLALTQVLKGLLYETSPNDPLTLVSVFITLTMIAITAGYIPARRASRINPMVALRAD